MLRRNKYIDKIKPFYNNELIKVITGVRRSGKTIILKTIQQDLIDSGVSNENILYINMESSQYFSISSYKEFTKYVIDYFTNVKGKVYIFVDEVQAIEKFEIAINALRVDLDSSIFITGSNSNILSGELATLLSGRYVTFNVYPFSFKEYIEWSGESPHSPKIFDNFLKYGGWPIVANISDPESKRSVLDDLFNTIVLKDIINRGEQIRDVLLLEKLIDYLVIESGNVFSIKSIVNHLNSNSFKTSELTISSYMKLIENSMLINKISRYDLKGKKILSRDDKYYIVDQSFKQLKQDFQSKDVGRLLEHVILNHCLSHGYKVYIGKLGDFEIDFKIVKHGIIKYIQVSQYLSTDEIIEREFRSLISIRDNYEKIIVSLDNIDYSRDGIKHINLIDFLMSDL